MPDRPLRLGDVIDDYCPRCRLLLNHDIASLTEAVAKVTCRTCYNTHDYRHAQVPRQAQVEEGRRQEEPDGPGAGAACRAARPSPARRRVRKRRDLWAEVERLKKK